MSEKRYSAKCFCGQIELEVTGDPIFQGFCHCDSCRSWLGAPVHAATLWPLENVSISRGAEVLATYKKSDRSHRKHCTVCGGHVINAHREEGFIDVRAPVLKDFIFKPTIHVHYGERILSMHDDLPKYKDLPSEFGGSGTLIEDSQPDLFCGSCEICMISESDECLFWATSRQIHAPSRCLFAPVRAILFL